MFPFNIFGQETRPSNRKVSYESEVVSEQDPGTQFVATGDPVGYIATSQEKHTGYVAKLWKVVTVDGVEESREEFNKSTYKASPKIVKSELHPQTRMHPPQSEQHLQRGMRQLFMRQWHRTRQQQVQCSRQNSQQSSLPQKNRQLSETDR